MNSIQFMRDTEVNLMETVMNSWRKKKISFLLINQIQILIKVKESKSK